MATGFHISAAWAGVIVAAVVPGCGGMWWFASSQSRTETKVEILDTRTAKMEARLDQIADSLDLHDKHTARATAAVIGNQPPNPAMASAAQPREPISLPLIGTKAFP